MMMMMLLDEFSCSIARTTIVAQEVGWHLINSTTSAEASYKVLGTQSVQNLEYPRIYLLHAAAEPLK